MFMHKNTKKEAIMLYKCRLHGKTEITEPIILELINAPELQRLTGIDQAGYFEPFFPNSKHTRFEHSIGCYLLLRKHNAPIEEQIAGLLHDISHSAFSHCADYALEGGSETEHTYQDNAFEKYILNSSIPEILRKYGFDVGCIIDESNFPLQETTLPDLCADRIDYSLRSLVAYSEISKTSALQLLNGLNVIDSKWVFKNLNHAKKFAELFSFLNQKYYAGIESAVMFRTVGDYLKYALAKKYISQEELHTTDEQVINKINQNLANDPHLQKLFNRMNNKSGYEHNENDYEAEVYCKSRIVDPLVSDGSSKPKRLSNIFPEWGKEVKKEQEPKRYFLKFYD
jgi:uncharacterized protein